jgi:hypothetical protein
MIQWKDIAPPLQKDRVVYLPGTVYAQIQKLMALQRYTIWIRNEHKTLYSGTVVANSEQEAFIMVRDQATAAGVDLPEEVWTRTKIH